MWLNGFLDFLSVERAVESYQLTVNFHKSDDWQDYWPLGFFPIVQSASDSIVVNCIKGSPTYGWVYDMGWGYGVTSYSDCIERYFDTLCAFVREGAIFLDADGVLDFDVDKEFEIHERMNPKVFKDGEYVGSTEKPDWIA